MKAKLLVIFFFIVFEIGYSQTQKPISGTVVCIDFVLHGIEVANLTSKNTTITNNSGNFSILAKPGDALTLVSKNYNYRTITLKQADFEKTNFIISLIKKPEELDEVVVTKIKFDKLVYNKYEQESLDKLTLKNYENKVKNPFIYDGAPSPYNMNLMRIGNDVGKIFKKIFKIQDSKRAIENKTTFKECVSQKIKPSFYTQSLLLKPEEVNLFLEFCDADATSKTILENPNPLKIMDFLFLKNAEFKKLSQ
jgi:hypothetical protein